jgi:hypothetical protein
LGENGLDFKQAKYCHLLLCLQTILFIPIKKKIQKTDATFFIQCSYNFFLGISNERWHRLGTTFRINKGRCLNGAAFHLKGKQAAKINKDVAWLCLR